MKRTSIFPHRQGTRPWLFGLLLLALLTGCERPAEESTLTETPADATPIAEQLAAQAAAPATSATTATPTAMAEPREATAVATGPTPHSPAGSPRIAIIIDDIGYRLDEGRRAIALPGALTYAVLPDTPHSRELAEAAHAAGKLVMLHLPMSNLGGKALGNDGLTPDMDHATFIATVHRAIAAVPHLQGVNNHTGSELTAREEPMRWLMAELKTRNLFFIDSRTTAESVAAREAQRAGLRSASRQVFLDNDTQASAIDAAFGLLLKKAREQGQAIAIGHPYPETVDYLARVLPLLPAAGIELVPASELLDLPAEASSGS